MKTNPDHRPFRLGPAREDQVPILLEMIRELAVFQGREAELEVTAAGLHAALFGSPPRAGALLAWHGHDAVGFAVYYRTFSTFTGRPGFWLEDLYVRPSFRRRGVGTALVEGVRKLGAAEGAIRYEWAALWGSEEALHLYRRLGAHVLHEWVLFRTTCGRAARPRPALALAALEPVI